MFEGGVEVVVPVTGAKSCEGVEAAGVGVVWVVRAVVPFSEASGFVSGVFEDISDCCFVFAHVFASASYTVSSCSEVVSSREE